MPKRTGLEISFYALLIAIGVPFGLLACGRSGLSPGDDDPCGHAVPIKAIAPGACVLTTAGDVRCRDYGFNDGDARIPEIDGLSGVKAIARGGAQYCALMTSGGVRCWGRNEYGQLGDGTLVGRSTVPASDPVTFPSIVRAGANVPATNLPSAAMHRLDRSISLGRSIAVAASDGSTRVMVSPAAT